MLKKPEDLIMSFGKAIEEAKLSHPVRCINWPWDHYLVKSASPDGETNSVVLKMVGSKLPAKTYQPTSEEMNSAWVYATVHQRLIDFTLDRESEYLCLNFHPIDTAEPVPEHPFIELYSRGMVSKDINVGFVSGNNMLNILNAVVYDALVRMQNEGIVDSHLLQFSIDDEFVNGGWKRVIYQDPSLYSFHNPTIANTVSWLHGFKPEVVIHDGIVGSSKLFEAKALQYCKMNGLEFDVDFQYTFASINSEESKKVTRL